MASAGLSGVGVGIATAGALLIYAGLRGVTPLQALRDVTSGKTPPPVVSKKPTATSPETQKLPDLDRPSGFTGPNAEIATAAIEEVGKPYRLGAAGPNVFDCSGLVKYVIKGLYGVNLPHSATAQERLSKHFRSIPRFEVQAGDLAFWTFHHVVIMTGNKSWVGAQNPRRGVTTGSDVNDAWTPNTPPTSFQRFRR